MAISLEGKEKEVCEEQEKHAEEEREVGRTRMRSVYGGWYAGDDVEEEGEEEHSAVYEEDFDPEDIRVGQVDGEERDTFSTTSAGLKFGSRNVLWLWDGSSLIWCSRLSRRWRTGGSRASEIMRFRLEMLFNSILKRWDLDDLRNKIKIRVATRSLWWLRGLLKNEVYGSLGLLSTEETKKNKKKKDKKKAFKRTYFEGKYIFDALQGTYYPVEDLIVKQGGGSAPEWIVFRWMLLFLHQNGKMDNSSLPEWKNIKEDFYKFYRENVVTLEEKIKEVLPEYANLEEEGEGSKMFKVVKEDTLRRRMYGEKIKKLWREVVIHERC